MKRIMIAYIVVLIVIIACSLWATCKADEWTIDPPEDYPARAVWNMEAGEELMRNFEPGTIEYETGKKIVEECRWYLVHADSDSNKDGKIDNLDLANLAAGWGADGTGTTLEEMGN